MHDHIISIANVHARLSIWRSHNRDIQEAMNFVVVDHMYVMYIHDPQNWVHLVMIITMLYVLYMVDLDKLYDCIMVQELHVGSLV